jgi:hypothetical protein
VRVVLTVDLSTTAALTPVTVRLLVVGLIGTALDSATHRLFVRAALIETKS